jgi:hypothetical protein
MAQTAAHAWKGAWIHQEEKEYYRRHFATRLGRAEELMVMVFTWVIFVVTLSFFPCDMIDPI